jgi:hypothetical protein
MLPQAKPRKLRAMRKPFYPERLYPVLGWAQCADALPEV